VQQHPDDHADHREHVDDDGDDRDRAAHPVSLSRLEECQYSLGTSLSTSVNAINLLRTTQLNWLSTCLKCPQ
jgi:hypothetical protein